VPSALGVSTPEEYSQQIRSRGGWARFARTPDPDTGNEDDILYWNILRDRDDFESQITVVRFRDKKRCETILNRVKRHHDSPVMQKPVNEHRNHDHDTSSHASAP
jgi:hypothetical protein